MNKFSIIYLIKTIIYLIKTSVSSLIKKKSPSVLPTTPGPITQGNQSLQALPSLGYCLPHHLCAFAPAFPYSRIPSLPHHLCTFTPAFLYSGILLSTSVSSQAYKSHPQLSNLHGQLILCTSIRNSTLELHAGHISAMVLSMEYYLSSV